MPTAFRADTDKAHGDAVAGRGGAIEPQNRARQNQRGDSSGGGAPQKLSAGEISIDAHIPFRMGWVSECADESVSKRTKMKSWRSRRGLSTGWSRLTEAACGLTPCVATKLDFERAASSGYRILLCGAAHAGDFSSGKPGVEIKFVRRRDYGTMGLWD